MQRVRARDLARHFTTVIIRYIARDDRRRCFPAEPYISCGRCLSVCLSQVGVLSKRLDLSSWFYSLYLRAAYPTLWCKGIGVPSKIRVLPSGTLSQTLDLEKFRHGTSAVASVVNVVRPTTVASLSHRASTFVYNTGSSIHIP